MKAIALTAVGPPENLVLVDLPVPRITADQVLVQVKAVSVNPAEAFGRRNQEALNFLYKLRGDEPHVVLGWDISGVVVEVGAAVTTLRPGDEVFGMVNYLQHAQGYAEYVAASPIDLALKPATISHAEAAGATLAALTAWQSLVTDGQLQAGEKIVILGASGGVGHYAVQIAKHLGAYVVAVGSPDNKDFLLQLGADEFIDYTSQRFEELVTDADLVHDAVWSDAEPRHIERSVRALKPGGRLMSLVTYFDDEFHALLKTKHLTGYKVSVQPNAADLARIAELLATGALKTHVSHTFPLAEMHRAHALIQTKNAVGKVIVTL
ncbi:NADP-dependent oxidoreductase [Hymenobacter metallicola]|uniref:NADP-dependent oxidoreductase n=1 Tax=Hymenobacter metallicola TaxID=2563114 RepID=A0A4Z0PZS7_9BACT|nr:NADP-dependent oxidoreductase [Hymenobacter metallicola]TGE22746.1 NADP-dependent oxidoreductase [Hymenobacter metallicola]